MTSDLPTVLVVDDERINRTLMAELLHEDCHVLLAKDGPSALKRIEEERVSLILLDASMPEMDGYEVLRRLKANEKTADIGVIFVTGQTTEEAEERGLLLGAADYITKPIRPLLVKARVRNHLKFARQRDELERLSLEDGLTGIANRRRFDMALELACRHTIRTGHTMGLAMIDVDHFKLYNDHYGHGSGDEALKQVARILAGATRRPYDLAARYGGEEFILLLGGGEGLESILEDVRAGVAELNIPHETSNTTDYLTISCGGLIVGPKIAADPSSALKLCDEALYEAKHTGRNRVVVRTGN
ncbi:MAG: diguanylate cyclase [Asticcacaulis sp.]